MEPPELKLGEDYYIEKGMMVFTAKYHLKRGHCCKNNCRHCPYAKEIADKGDKKPII